MSPNSDPRLIKGLLDSNMSLINSLLYNANQASSKVEDPQVRQALISMEAILDLQGVLVRIALEPYFAELEERIKHGVQPGRS